ncbi:Sulfate permease, MFS superfamily [Thermosyntropha lipolytica DSM 11003]|uniref:Sulfate permease, MFS superfamily n=1 Tax=Thermosyntropha lipolytica DSM 11003 TaxID=1123382 RepID=A0A1M5LTJ4_9FIRM|nr:solute carrier family 23 protein [Thermosyntropha lipolytica]SHG68452.1 Sulfate permease, MFS superfamily [Thermosyntropha lipolytica DSM 11003]
MSNWQEKRPYGQEAPYIPLWKFKMRFPGIHYRWEWPDYIQGLLMGAVCLSIIPVLMDVLGMPFEVALAIVILNGFLYLWHAWLGDPVVPGWVTPAIPLLIAYVSAFPAGPERMHALIAFELLLGIWCIFLGVTGLANKVISMIPRAIKVGVILGAGVAAIKLVFDIGGRYDTMPITVSICALVALFIMYNPMFRSFAARNKVAGYIANLGILPAIVAAIIIAWAVGEAKFAVEWGISKPAFGQLWRDWVPWGTLGWPSFDMYIKAIPMVLASYIVIFGDAVQCQAIIRDADPYRPDEPVEYDPDRAHIIVGLRNSIMSILGPDISMCGPIWAAMTVVTYERWKKGRDKMDSIFGGVGSFRFGTFTTYWLLPLVTITKPILAAALALTMIIQGFVSVYVGVREARSLTDLGIGGIVAGVLIVRGAAWAFIVGIIAVLVIYGRNFFKGDVEAAPLWAFQVSEKDIATK